MRTEFSTKSFGKYDNPIQIGWVQYISPRNMSNFSFILSSVTCESLFIWDQKKKTFSRANTNEQTIFFPPDLKKQVGSTGFNIERWRRKKFVHILYILSTSPHNIYQYRMIIPWSAYTALFKRIIAFFRCQFATVSYSFNHYYIKLGLNGFSLWQYHRILTYWISGSWWIVANTTEFI